MRQSIPGAWKRRYLEGLYLQVRIAELRLDGDAPRAEAHIPETAALLQLQEAEAHQAYRHLGDHIHSPIEGEEVELLEPKRSGVLRWGLMLQDEAIGVGKVAPWYFL